jgi:hypothetical protein
VPGQLRTLGIHFVGEPQTFLAENSHVGTTNHLLLQFILRSETSEEADEEYEVTIVSRILARSVGARHLHSESCQGVGQRKKRYDLLFRRPSEIFTGDDPARYRP